MTTIPTPNRTPKPPPTNSRRARDRHPVSTLCVYSRAQAIKDGELVDVTETAAWEGFTVPVAFSRLAYRKAVVDAAEAMSQITEFPESNQLAGVLDMIHFYVVHAPPADRLTVSFDIFGERVTFEVVCGPDDAGDTCVTIVLAAARS